MRGKVVKLAEITIGFGADSVAAALVRVLPPESLVGPAALSVQPHQLIDVTFEP